MRSGKRELEGSVPGWVSDSPGIEGAVKDREK